MASGLRIGFWIFLGAMALAVGSMVPALVRPQIHGDGFGYYAPLASVVFDRDLDLRDEIAPVGPRLLRAVFLTPEGRLGDPFAVGPAILWAPAVLAARATAPPDPPGAREHGFGRRYAWALVVANVVLVLGSAIGLAWSLARFVSPLVAATALVGAVCGTPTLLYVLAAPAYGHAAAFAASAVLLALVLVDRKRRLPLPLLGAAWALAALVRWQDAVEGLLLAPRLLEAWRAAGSPLRRGRLVASFLLPAILVFLPQMLFWQHIYGKLFLRPPGAELLPWWSPQIPKLLFSTWNGAFVWSPALAAGLLGWIWGRDRALGFAVLAVALLEVWTSATAADWWGGASFGARRLVSLAPIAAAGMAWVLGRVPSRIGAAALLASLAFYCVWNVRMGSLQVKGRLPYNPGHWAGLVHPEAGRAARDTSGLWDYPRLLEAVRPNGS